MKERSKNINLEYSNFTKKFWNSNVENMENKAEKEDFYKTTRFNKGKNLR